MVKIRSYISKKSVPKGIDINNKEYWQPLELTVKGNNGGGGGNGGDVTGKCNITIVTNPSTATIVATDSKGNRYTSKQFSVDKGVQVTVIATPPSTGYKTTTAVISSQQTNYDNFTYTLTLDVDVPVGTNTTVTVISNVSGAEIGIYNANDVKLNNGNDNYANNVPVGSIIKVSTNKSGYQLVNSSHGTITKEGNYYNIRNITVVENLRIVLEYSEIQEELPTISGLLSSYDATYESQTINKVFRSKFRKIRIYGDLPISFSTSWQDSVNDPLGGQSITDISSNPSEQEITFVVVLNQNITGLARTYNFTVVAENEEGTQVTKTFAIVQNVQSAVYRKVSIVAQINGIASSSSEITRVINGSSVNQGQQIDVLDGNTVTFYALYLGKVIELQEVITADTVKEINFEIVNIALGTVSDEHGYSFNTWDLTLTVPVLNLVKENWRGELVSVVKGTEYRVTGIDTSGLRPIYDSGVRIATGSAINIVFGANLTAGVIIEVRDSVNTDFVITNADIKLKVGTVQYNNGYAFPIGTRVGYVIQHSDYEIASLSDGSIDAIVAGVTNNPVIVYLIPKPEYVNVTVNTYLNGSHATGAKIYLDDVLQGTGSPYVLQNLVNGSSHNLRVELEGYLDKQEAFVASLNGVINFDFGNINPTHYALAVTMLDPSDALIEVNDYTDGILYTGIGELYKQIGANHEITVKMSKEGYMPKHMPANANNGGRIIMDNDKSWIDQTLDEVVLPSTCYYAISPNPSDAKVEFSETENGAYEEYPSKMYTTFVGRTIYWRVSKQGYVTQMGNSGVLEGNKQDIVTLQAEESNVNNNVLFAITSIKDKDTNEDLTGVTVNLRLKNVNLPTNKTITQSDIEEVVDNPSSQWNQYLGLYGGVSAKGTNVEITITKTGYETYNHSFSIPVDYEGNVLGIDIKIQTPKCDFTLYPIQDLGENNLIPDAVYIREGDDNFTENDRIQLVANRYKLQVNRGANVYYLVLKTGYGGGYGSVSNVNLSQAQSVTLLAVSAPAETVTLRIYGTNDGTKTLPKTAASQPILFDLEGYNVYSGSFVGGNYYAYDFTIPKNVLVKAQTIWGNKCVSLVGSFSKNAEVLMWFTEPDYPNYVDLRLYPMVEGEQFMNNNNNFSSVVKKVGSSSTIQRYQAGNDTLLHFRELYSIRESVKIHIVGSIDGYANITKDYPFGDITTLYMNFVDNPSQEPYLRVRIDGSSWYATDGQTTIQFDGNGDTHNIQIESNEDWVVE